jgi:hypothetical protein
MPIRETDHLSARAVELRRMIDALPPGPVTDAFRRELDAGEELLAACVGASACLDSRDGKDGAAA